MDAFRSIVLRGHLRNAEKRSSMNPAADSLELIPNNTDKDRSPVSFGIKFITEDLLVEYSFTADLGEFLEMDYSRKIVSESLSINESQIFLRKKNKLEFGNLDGMQAFFANVFEENSSSAKALASGNLNKDELFLMNGFKNIFSSKLVSLITTWLEEKFLVVYRADAMQIVKRIDDPQKKSIYVEKTLNEAASSFGINSNALGYIAQGDNNESRLYSIFNKKAVPAEMFESYGTIRFINMFALVTKTLSTGGTLVVDEFDASIHPMALMNIINIFHNDEINVHRAQLIFNTHNPIFLNYNLYRRDEIKFVDRDDETHSSTQYSLAEFGTSGSSGVRKNEDYMKNYFVDRYGAIKDIDFTPIFEELIKPEKEV